MKYFFTFFLLCRLLVFGNSQSINCDQHVYLSQNEIEIKKDSIEENTNSNEEIRYKISNELYCHAIRSNDKLLTAFACNHLGLYYYQKRVKSKSFHFLQKAEEIIADYPSSEIYRDNLNYFGLLYHFTGDHTLAITYLKKFNEVCLIQKSSPSKIADSNNDLGLIYIDVGEYELAKDALTKAYEVLMKEEDKFGSGYALLNLGRNEFLNNDSRPLAISYAQKAIAVWNPISFKRGLFYANNALSEFHLNHDDKKALSYAQKTLELAIENNFGSLGNVYRNLGQAQLNLQQFEGAKESFQFCLSYAQEHYIRDLFEVSYKNLISLYEVEGDLNGYKTLAEMSNLYFTTKDQQEQSADKEWVLMTQKSSQMNEQLNSQEELIEKQSFYNKLLLALSVLIGLFGFSTFLYWLKLKKQNLKLEEANKSIQNINEALNKSNHELNSYSNILEENKKEIEQQNRQLRVFADQKILLYNDRRNFLNQIQKHLNQINHSNQSISDLKRFVKENSSDITWQELDKLTSIRNIRFKENILKKHPNLTQKDLLLCNYLLMDLSTKEIANLNYQNPDTVKVARSRLRKKLEIKDSKSSLSMYLRNFK